MKKLSDMELYQHFVDYVDYADEGGICFVTRSEYEHFVSKLPLIDSDHGFDAHVTTYGELCFDIDNVAHFFDDFETFKDLFLKHFGEGGE